MYKKTYLSILFIVCFIWQTKAQLIAPRNGVYDERDKTYVFINATIWRTFDTKIEGAMLLVSKGKIVAVGNGTGIPEDAVVIDLHGKHIYPSFIDLYSTYGVPEPTAHTSPSRPNRGQQINTTKKGAFMWNEALHPEINASDFFTPNEKEAEIYRKMGFGTVLSHQMDGISRGTSVLTGLGNAPAHEMIVKEQVAHHLSFNKGSSKQNYPSSQMGAIALLRQTYLDGKWYKNYGHKVEKNISLRAWNDVQSLPQIFEVTNKLEIFRAAKIAQEFGKRYYIKGAGDEYQRLGEIKALRSALIIPLNFPKAFDVEDFFDANIIPLSSMKHWEMAPTNPGRLDNAGIEITLTTNGLEKKQDFIPNLRKAIKSGLSKTAALKALTFTPAKLAGAYDDIGSLEPGKWANFIITSGDIFEEETFIYHNWVKGQGYIIKKIDTPNLLGEYDLVIDSDIYNLEVSGNAETPTMEIVMANDSTKRFKVNHQFKNGLINLSFKLQTDNKAAIRLSGVLKEKEWEGKGQTVTGDWVNWKATFVKEKKEAKKENKSKEEGALGKITYPLMAYGWESSPQLGGGYLFKNATVWTNEKDGILKNTDVLIRNGKIAQIGENIQSNGVIVIDGTGKHLTSGIVDEHSHIAISKGVNECSETVTAEVRIGDVINSDDINIFRQLAGGVTTVQLLHGSCNPIGGQSGIIKLRWGYAPENMKIKNADGFIKFALGENVKASRVPANQRFPDTRMGVEQVYRDAFTRAKEYNIKLRSNPAKTRRNIELDALVEILNKKRFISCHSYVQSEINMLMHIADEMDFRVNTFTHILEGYKVADKMKAHGVGASTFSDWWAYKYEVVDAIPYNGAILHEQGVTTAYNSDDAEVGRHLNQEAAKAIKYGGVSEEEAWKFVTLNPAKLLHLDDQIGSIKVGKDADVVLWSDNPLSMYTKAEMTFIDGLKFYDSRIEKLQQQEIQKERHRLIQKMLDEKAKGMPTQGVKGKDVHTYHCDDY